MYIITIFYQFLLILTNFRLILRHPYFLFQIFFKLIITHQVFFSPEYPHFIFVYVSFCFKMQIILIFYKFMPNFGPILGLPTFFLDFVQFIITYHVFFILEYPNFVLFYVFFCFKMHIIPIFYQFLTILTNFGPILGLPIFFLYFF